MISGVPILVGIFPSTAHRVILHVNSNVPSRLCYGRLDTVNLNKGYLTHLIILGTTATLNSTQIYSRFLLFVTFSSKTFVIIQQEFLKIIVLKPAIINNNL